MMSEIETIDIKASYSVSRVLRTLLDAVFSRDDEDDMLSFSDKELLEDVLRFGTIAEVSRRKGVGYGSLLDQVEQALTRLKRKITRFELEMAQISFDNKNSQKLLEQQKLALIDGGLQLIQKNQLLAQTQGELISMQRKIDKANNKAESYKAEIEAKKAIIDQKNDEIKQLKATLKKMEREMKKMKKPSEREQKLRARIDSLENMIMRYKTEGISALMAFEPASET